LLKCLTLIASMTWLIVFSFPDNRLHLVFCDVGQGDATLITKGFTQILIDGGPNDKVLTCLKNNLPFFDRTIEVVALTHPEADHLTGLISVLDKYKVEYFLTGPEGNDSAIYQELLARLTKSEILNPKSKIKDTNFQNPKFKTFKKLKFLLFGFVSNFVLRASDLTQVVNPYAGEKIKIGEITLDSLWPSREWMAENIEAQSVLADFSLRQNERGLKPSKTESVLGAKTRDSKLNDYCLVFLLTYRGKKVLLMGDADSRVQDKIISANSWLFTSLKGIDILKFPHHGSKTGMDKNFLEQIKPKIAVISVGKNSFGHPAEETLEMLKNAGVKVRRTDLEGEIKYNF